MPYKTPNKPPMRPPAKGAPAKKTGTKKTK
jgi:hypothetical protein